jgi:hypothetical protein
MVRRLAIVLVTAAVAALAFVPAHASPSRTATVVRQPLLTMIRALPVAAPSHASAYNRSSEFGDWVYRSTAYGHCNTRALVLIQESQVATTRNRYCTVLSGRWVSMYNDAVLTNPYGGTYVQIDHLIPVENAWISGAWAWSQARRVAFYNDLGDTRSLNAVDSHDNAAKGDKTPAGWMPLDNRCRYIRYWVAVKTRWSLHVTATERAALLHDAAGCGNPLIVVTKA